MITTKTRKKPGPKKKPLSEKVMRIVTYHKRSTIKAHGGEESVKQKIKDLIQ